MLKRTPEDAAVLVSFVNKSTNPMPSNLFKMTPSDVFFFFLNLMFFLGIVYGAKTFELSLIHQKIFIWVYDWEN